MYTASGTVVSVGVGGDVVYRIGGMATIGVDGEYRVGLSEGGFHYQNDLDEGGDVPFSTHDLRVGASAGLALGSVRVAARGGYRYQLVQIRDLENVGRLAHERVLGATAGGRLSVTPIADKLTLHGGADVLLGGSLEQTPGLEDGDVRDVSTVSASMGASLRLSNGMDSRTALRVH